MPNLTYLDCNATTPVEPKVAEVVLRYLRDEFGNAGSRTHAYGSLAKQAIQKARDQVAEVATAEREEVLFTSGATESNNLAILGLAAHGEKEGRRHILTTAIEHKAVLEPLGALEARGFEVEYLLPEADGSVTEEALASKLRNDTLLVSVMHANNETGVVQPIDEITELLGDHPAYLHVDAAQTFGKVIEPLRSSRIDLISVSAHKLYGPKGVGALIARRRGFKRPPLAPLLYGGGQERGLRPGTQPVPLIAGLGEACALGLTDWSKRERRNLGIRDQALAAFSNLDLEFNGDPDLCLPHVLNLSFAGVDSEAVMVALKSIAAVSNGSACTSSSYEPSHVLTAMGLDEDRIAGAVRISWCHLTPEVDWEAIAAAIGTLA